MLSTIGLPCGGRARNAALWISEDKARHVHHYEPQVHKGGGTRFPCNRKDPSIDSELTVLVSIVGQSPRPKIASIVSLPSPFSMPEYISEILAVDDDD